MSSNSISNVLAWLFTLFRQYWVFEILCGVKPLDSLHLTLIGIGSLWIVITKSTIVSVQMGGAQYLLLTSTHSRVHFGGSCKRLVGSTCTWVLAGGRIKLSLCNVLLLLILNTSSTRHILSFLVYPLQLLRLLSIIQYVCQILLMSGFNIYIGDLYISSVFQLWWDSLLQSRGHSFLNWIDFINKSCLAVSIVLRHLCLFDHFNRLYIPRII